MLRLTCELGLHGATYLFSTQLVEGKFLSPVSYSQDVIMFLSNQQKTKEVIRGHSLLMTVAGGSTNNRKKKALARLSGSQVLHSHAGASLTIRPSINQPRHSFGPPGVCYCTDS